MKEDLVLYVLLGLLAVGAITAVVGNLIRLLAWAGVEVM